MRFFLSFRLILLLSITPFCCDAQGYVIGFMGANTILKENPIVKYSAGVTSEMALGVYVRPKWNAALSAQHIWWKNENTNVNKLNSSHIALRFGYEIPFQKLAVQVLFGAGYTRHHVALEADGYPNVFARYAGNSFTWPGICWSPRLEVQWKKGLVMAANWKFFRGFNNTFAERFTAFELLVGFRLNVRK